MKEYLLRFTGKHQNNNKIAGRNKNYGLGVNEGGNHITIKR